MERMAASTTSGYSLPRAASTRAVPVPVLGSSRPRRISPEAGHALEKLGHAIEYLSDEFVHNGGDLRQHDPQVEAVQMLIALNREVYFSCPEIPSLGDKLRSILHRTTH
jgi:hypothetical protein